MRLLLSVLLLSVLLLSACGPGAARPALDLVRDQRSSDLARDLRDLSLDGRGDLPSIAGHLAQVMAGSFQMGSPDTELCREPGETLHQVALTRSFEILASEVTEAAFVEQMGYRPPGSCGPACPVRNVSWHEAVAFANALSIREGLPACYTCTGSLSQVRCASGPLYPGTEPGKLIYDCVGYRLPTEAEWERAYRAGSTTALHGGSLAGSCSGEDPVADTIAWYKHSSGGAAHPIGGKQANAWGLHDLAGNVAEWIHDGLQPYGTLETTDPLGAESNERAVRGGSFESEVAALRAAARTSDTPGTIRNDRGFRVARSRP